MFFFLLCFFGGQLKSQDFEWANSIGGIGEDRGFSIVTDASRNVYVLGAFRNTANFDPGVGTFNLTSNGNSDIFLAKYDMNGNFLWANKIGGTGDDQGWNINLDANGNIYITGLFQNIVDFDPGAGVSNLTSSGGYDVFFAKYDTNGNYVWARKVGGAGDDRSLSIHNDLSGNIYITGWFNGTSNFDPGAGTYNLTSNGNSDIFFAKYDMNGNFLWANKIGGSGADLGTSIIVDSSGNVYISGYFSNTVDFDPGADTYNLTSNGNTDIFFAKYDMNGYFLWANSIGGTGEDQSWSITLDTFANIYITGWFTETADFNPSVAINNLTSNGSNDIFFAKYNTNGDFIWANNIGSTGIDQGLSIELDIIGNIYLTGFYSNTIDFDPAPSIYNLTSNGTYDVFFAKYDTNGDFLWANSIGGTGDDFGRSIAIDNSGNVLITGWFTGTADFDISTNTFNLTSNGSFDIYFVKYSQTTIPRITTIDITNIRMDSAQSGGEIITDGWASIIYRGVVWDTNPNPTIALTTKTSEGIGTGTFTSIVTGLQENTTYYLRSYATNSVGTAYGNEIIFTTTISIEKDGNQDGILDTLQDNIFTIIDGYEQTYITIISPVGTIINSVKTGLNDDIEYVYPFGELEFKINASQAVVKLIFHGATDFTNYTYRKLFPDNKYKQFDNVTYSTETIGGKQVAVATLTLVDGGTGDYDGIVNGVIYDPGGPALPVSANIPFWDWWWVLVLAPGLVYSYRRFG